MNHLKLLSHTVWQTDQLMIEANLAYQNNRREEHSEPVSHGFMPKPVGTMERRFNKDTYTAKVGLKLHLAPQHELQAGAAAEWIIGMRKE